MIIYVNEKYTISCEDCYSDSVCESICLFINELNMEIITVYIPPNCGNNEFISFLNIIEDKMKEMKAKKENIKFVMNGDFNINFL